MMGPPLLPAEMLEVSMIASVAGEIDGGALTNRRSFRAPHHSASMAALVGGGLRAKPGEISLAHNGVLFLDELPEFDGRVLDSPRQPLEIGGGRDFPRQSPRHLSPALQLVVAINPCRCGRALGVGYPGRRRADFRNRSLPSKASLERSPVGLPEGTPLALGFKRTRSVA